MNHIIEAEKEYRNVRSIIMLDRYKKNKERERERERERDTKRNGCR